MPRSKPASPTVDPRDAWLQLDRQLCFALYSSSLAMTRIYKPLLATYGFDPIWFWTEFLIVATVGALTPPFGYVLFAMKSAVPNLALTDIYKASWPFVWIICLGMVILWFFPGMITWLPNAMK